MYTPSQTREAKIFFAKSKIFPLMFFYPPWRIAKQRERERERVKG